MSSSPAYSIPHSARAPAPGAAAIGDADPAATLGISLRLRAKPGAPDLPVPGAQAHVPVAARRHLSRDEFAQRNGSAPEDVEAVRQFASAHGLAVAEADAGRRTVVLRGSIKQINAAFGVTLKRYHTGKAEYLGHAGPASVPAELADIVQSVHGLDTRPVAQPLFRAAPGNAAGSLGTTPLLPAQVAKLYGVPANSAAGQTIGILEFGGGYKTADVQAYFTNIAKLPVVPTVSFVGIDGATNTPGGDADTEVILDIAVAGSVAPGAKIVVYFAPNTDQGWIDAVTTAIHDRTNKPSSLSISWGGGESGWGNITAMSNAFAEAAALGVSIFASSGDGGAGQPAEVLYPASDPGISGCGGVTVSNVAGNAYTQVAWGGSGGGVSNAFGKPSWQSFAAIPVSTNPAGHVGRGVPDIAGNADPSSGYELVLNGQPTGPWGGTSAVAPFYAGLVAVLNAAVGAPLGFLNNNLYTMEGPAVFNDVTAGTNGAYKAGNGWDAVTGLGSIIGTGLQTALLGIGLPPALAVLNGQVIMAWKGIEFDEGIYFTTYNGKVWAPQSRVANVGTSTGVALAVFNNALYMAWKGLDNDQGLYWSSYNGAVWAPQKLVSGVASSTGPRLAVFDNKLVMAWKGMEDDQSLWWSSFDGTNWAAQQRIAGVASSVGPALVVFGNALFAAWKGEFGDPGLYYASFNGVTWTQQTLIADTGSSEGPSLGVFNNQIYAVWKGEFSDQRLYYSAFNGSAWAPQKQIPGVLSSVGPGLVPFGNALLMAWKGMTGDERIWFSSFNGTTWTPQAVVPNVGTSTDLIISEAA